MENSEELVKSGTRVPTTSVEPPVDPAESEARMHLNRLHPFPLALGLPNPFSSPTVTALHPSPASSTGCLRGPSVVWGLCLWG